MTSLNNNKRNSYPPLPQRRKNATGRSSSLSLLCLQQSLPTSFLFLLLIGLVLTINIHFVLHYSLPSPSFGNSAQKHSEPAIYFHHALDDPPSLLRIISNNDNENDNDNESSRTFTTKQDHDYSSVSYSSSSFGQSKEQLPAVEPKKLPEMSACLIVMDDNHFLIEWLAYHYHTANLRHLIITSDPNSMTKPTHILNRWKDKINIQEWTDDDFLPGNFEQRVQNRLRHNTKDPLLQNHRERQWYFNLQCLRKLKKQNRDWTMLIDTDEYLAVNPESLQQIFEYNKVHHVPNPKPLTTKIPIANTTSIPTILNSIQIPNPFYEESIQSPCIGMYRRQFTALETEPIDLVQKHVPTGLNGMKFQTMRWRKYGYDRHKIHYKTKTMNNTKCDLYIHRRVPNKVVIDLGRLRLQDLYNTNNKGNPHLPLDICPTDVYFDGSQTPFVVHHYMGTPEQWFYRTSDKRGMGYRRARYIDLNEKLGRYENDLLRPWLQDFVNTIGIDEAKRLLKDVGELEPVPIKSSLSTASNIANDVPSDSDNTISGGGNISSNSHSKYQIGDVVHANFHGEGEWYLAEISSVFPDEYYNTIYFDDCTEEIALPGSRIRPLETGDN